MLKRNKTNGLADRLRNFMGTVKVDLFGHEERANSKMKTYFKALGQQTNVPVPDLSIRVRAEPIIATLHYRDNHLRDIRDTELIKLFTGAEHISGLSERMHRGLERFFATYAGDRLDKERLYLKFIQVHDRIMVGAIYQGRFLANVPLGELINTVIQ